MTNKEKYKKAFDVLAASEKISLEAEQMNNKKQKRHYKRSIVAAVAAFVFVVTAGTGVYAATKYWGILDFSDRTSKKVPKEAISQIQTDVNATQKKNNTIFNCKVKEALSDSQSMSIVYEVSAKEAGKYLFVPMDALPEDPMSDWCNDPKVADKTVQEYANEKGLTIVNIGGGISNSDELGIESQTFDFLSVSDDVMDVFITSEKSAKSRNVDLEATMRISGENEPMRLTSNFTLQDMSETTSTTYLYKNQNSAETFFKVEKAEVIQTDLGTYVDVYYNNKNGENPEDGLHFRVVDQAGKEYESVGSSGVENTGANQYKLRCILNKCDLGNRLYLEAYDCYEKNVYGTIELQKK